MQLPDAEILLKSLAKKIRSEGGKDFVLVGIHTGGVWLAERLHQELGITQPLGTLDVSFYRDDFDKIGLHSQVKPSEIPFEVEGAHIILVDDVLYTGRTIRAAINELFDYGRPASISLATLVDRGGRELPIAAQYTGIALELPVDKMLELKREENGKLSLNLYDKRLPE
ncbi:MAG: bifunctional pyr operon transcriptional regulator/uracil phosphoribosyltransferase PyrR [Nitrosomonas sp.]|jgi:pyrimidine operon attenuation protein/uracil phosphoribosyltransferase|uniref:bifunctional pyr operon transcriptional regulator/uracil phosphoribosyltransferase PyrR n=1 Tax=Nitrosomonas sp. TaxID=42353 RepID=UPI00272FA9EE|nr:bifunctional pyr operon transcriptional regulator/uracil phosphoribosyltransferase PyrR [Nitrosomonas sp.]MDP1549359.1 bifunctional pyr operon transcriptional regulator/uracil phosphoribosyltransferase PyrR [Nitrosomonas sp.]MDP3279549.1 bifunctional pyr operon transcriptional regulator/uracil phosphoribosyltransferase PyrR [Nitrosomonas sp.]